LVVLFRNVNISALIDYAVPLNTRWWSTLLISEPEFKESGRRYGFFFERSLWGFFWGFFGGGTEETFFVGKKFSNTAIRK
jgi:hypothetical protein